ncbi:MAG: TAXI family TRAP transporter solute-binding subunit [Dichotomicrobium sp.]
MPRDNPAFERIRRQAGRLRPPSDGVWRWLPAGIGVATVLAIGIVYALVTGGRAAQVTIATGTENGTYHALGEAIAETLSQGDPPIHTRIVQSDGASDNARLVRSNPNVLGFVQSNTPVTRDVRLLARLYPEVFHLLVRGDREISDVGDLAGKRVALMPEGSGSNNAFFTLIEHYQVSKNSIQPVSGSLQDGLRALEDGTVDGLFVVMALGNDAIAQSIRRDNIQLLGLDQAQAMALFDPALTLMEVPKGVYSGDKPVPPEPVEVLSVDALLVANHDMPDEIANAVVTTLYEHRQRMVKTNPQAAFISEPTGQQKLAIGVHPGAESYYQRDKPALLVAYAEPIGVAVSVLVLLVSGMWQARTWLSNTRKNRADRYNMKIAALVDEAEEATSLERIEEIRRNLFAIFNEVIADLDDDRIDENSLNSFSFVWNVAQSTLSQRSLMLTGQQKGPAKRRASGGSKSAARSSG